MQLVDHNHMFQYVHVRIDAFTTIYVVDHSNGKVGRLARPEYTTNHFAMALKIAMQMKNDCSMSWIKVSRHGRQVGSIEDDEDALEALFKSLYW
jgi:hypothetical protein